MQLPLGASPACVLFKKVLSIRSCAYGVGLSPPLCQLHPPVANKAKLMLNLPISEDVNRISILSLATFFFFFFSLRSYELNVFGAASFLPCLLVPACGLSSHHSLFYTVIDCSLPCSSNLVYQSIYPCALKETPRLVSFAVVAVRTEQA